MQRPRLKPTLGDKIALVRGIITGERARIGPFHVTIDASSRCNLRCLGCRYQDPQINFPSPGEESQKDIPFELIQLLCAELKEMGTNAMILTGEGEPFLHPQLSEIIAAIKSNGYHLTLRTNGTLMTEENVHHLIDNEVDILKVSLWASDQVEYQKLYPGVRPETFEKTLDGFCLVDRIKRERKSPLPKLAIHHVVTRHNYRTVDRMIDLAHSKGVDAVYFAPFKAWQGTLTDEFVPEANGAELKRLLNIAREKAGDLGVEHNIQGALLRFEVGNNVWETFPCYIGWFHARVKLDGTVLPCDPYEKPMGNLKRNGIREIWEGPRYREFRRRGLTCASLAELGKYSDCGFCCHLVNNARFHSAAKWLKPFIFRNGGK
jgi:MoaA/NifB/PqqE/SkfB family radical SAM enzyme